MATYGLATTWDLRRPGEDPTLATELYQEILAAAPDGPMIPWTELALARQQHLVPVGQEPDYAAVNAAYRHIMEKFPGHLAAKEAFLYLAKHPARAARPQDLARGREKPPRIRRKRSRRNSSAPPGPCWPWPTSR